MSSMQTLQVLTVREVGNALNVTHQTVYKLIENGNLKAFRLRGDSGPFRVYKESLDEYIGTAVDTAFVKLLGEVFSGEEDKRYIRLLELLYRDGLSREEAGGVIGETSEKIYRWVVNALSVLSPIMRDRLTFDDVKDDKFALRVTAHIFLAQE